MDLAKKLGMVSAAITLGALGAGVFLATRPKEDNIKVWQRNVNEDYQRYQKYDINHDGILDEQETRKYREDILKRPAIM